MYIDLQYLIDKYKLKINRVLHIGAHECEELGAYRTAGISDKNMVWIDGNIELVNNMKKKGMNNIYHALVSNIDNSIVDFIITNNGQSSSILELKEHTNEHPGIYEVSRIKETTTTIDSFYKANNLQPEQYNFVNIDIQGAELLALKGMKDALNYIDYIYTKVFIKELYADCCLISDIDNYLKIMGFRRVETHMTQHGWGDAFYIKDDTYAKCLGGTDEQVNGEMSFYNLIKHNIKVLFDIGARESLYYCVNDSTIYHLFEPQVSFYNTLIQQAKKNNIIVNNCGLSDSCGTITYYNRSQSFFKRNICGDNDTDICIVNISTLDIYCDQNNITNIDFIKIDVEGSELAVLKGGQKILKNTNIIQFEYGGTYPDANIKLADVYSYLEDNGFKYFYIIGPDCLLYQPNAIEHLQYSNYVASKKSIYTYMMD